MAKRVYPHFSISVPNAVAERLKRQAETERRTPGNLALLYIVDALDAADKRKPKKGTNAA
jgi:hypothetical protein